MGVPPNGWIWMVDKGKYHENDRTWMKTGGTPISGNLHIMEFNGT